MRGVEAPEQLGVSNTSNLFSKILSAMGGYGVVLSAFETICSIFPKRNKRVNGIIQFLRLAVPIFLTIERVCSAIRIHYKDRVEATEDELYEALGKICGRPPNEVSRAMLARRLDIGDELADWIYTRPPLTSLKILGMYDGHGNTIKTRDEDTQTIFFRVNFQGDEYVLQFRYRTDLTSNYLAAASLIQFGEYHEDAPKAVIKALSFDYVKTFDVKSNIIFFSDKGITQRKKVNVEFQPNQFNVPSLISEIKAAITSGVGRSYVFASVPGCGKTTIFQIIATELNDVPVIHLQSSAFKSWSTESTAQFVEIMSPCVVIIDDVDGLGLTHKNEKTRSFMELLESIRANGSTVLMALNDSSEIHYSIINRSGRSDMVILLGPPKTKQDVRDAFTNCGAPPPRDDAILVILENGFTYADICEVVQKTRLTSMTYIDAINAIISSKQAISECDFGGNKPANSNQLEEVCPAEAPKI